MYDGRSDSGVWWYVQQRLFGSLADWCLWGLQVQVEIRVLVKLLGSHGDDCESYVKVVRILHHLFWCVSESVTK